MNNIVEFNIDALIEEYSNYVFKIVNNLVGTSLPYEDKEEIVSDVFFLLWKNQSNIQSNLKAYLGTITRNCCYAKLKNTNSNCELNDNFGYLEQDIDDLIMINNKLKRLKSEEVVIFKLFYVDGFKIKEIAKYLNKRSNSIKIALFRIRKKLKEEFYDEK